MMKRSNAFSIIITGILTLGCILSHSCEKSDNGGNGDQKNHHMTAKVDGQAFVASEDQLAAVHQDGYLFISGATENEEKIITFQFFDFPGQASTYIIGNNEYETHCFYSDETVSFFIFDDDPESNGTIIITDLSSSSVRGTFNFTGVTVNGEATVQVTDGSFFIPIYNTP